MKSIEVEGNHYYKDNEVINLAGARTGVNLFWGISTGDLKDSLSKDPYFAEVKVKRELPSTLVIEVVERQQIAAIDSDLTLLLPPLEMLGDLTKTADIKGLINWLKNLEDVLKGQPKR